MIRWIPREPPLAPCAVIARGDVACRLAARLLTAPDDALSALRGLSGSQPALLLICGARDALPWVDGVHYLGASSGTPRMWMPTQQRPEHLHPALILQHLMRSSLQPPIALLPEWDLVISAAQAQAIDRATLSTWLAAQEPR